MRLSKLFLCAVLFCATPAQAEPGNMLVLNTGVGAPYTRPDRSGFLDRLVAEVFSRVGLRAEIQVYDATERALSNANAGIDDGDAMRIKGLEALYPNLVRVPEKVIDNDFVALSARHALPTPGWETLAPYQVGHIIGWKIYENRLAGHRGVTVVRNAEQLFELLRQERADLILYERWQGLWWLRHLGLAARVLEPPLAREEMFIYVHRRHAPRLTALAAALAAMKKDGSYRRIYDETLAPLLSEAR